MYPLDPWWRHTPSREPCAKRTLRACVSSSDAKRRDEALSRTNEVSEGSRSSSRQTRSVSARPTPSERSERAAQRVSEANEYARPPQMTLARVSRPDSRTVRPSCDSRSSRFVRSTTPEHATPRAGRSSVVLDELPSALGRCRSRARERRNRRRSVGGATDRRRLVVAVVRSV